MGRGCEHSRLRAREVWRGMMVCCVQYSIARSQGRGAVVAARHAQTRPARWMQASRSDPARRKHGPQSCVAHGGKHARLEAREARRSMPCSLQHRNGHGWEELVAAAFPNIHGRPVRGANGTLHLAAHGCKHSRLEAPQARRPVMPRSLQHRNGRGWGEGPAATRAQNRQADADH